jgi:hypothetical protein
MLRQQMWKNFGWFSGLVCAGSVSGAVAFGVSMQNFVFYYVAFAPGESRQNFYSMYAQSYSYFSAFYVLYAVEFLCLVISKLMLLGRLMNTASRNWHNSTPAAPSLTHHRLQPSLQLLTLRFGIQSLPRLHTVMVTLVSLCSVISLVAYTVAAAYGVLVSDLSSQAAAACDSMGTDTNSSLPLVARALAYENTSYDAQSVQNVCEALALLFISIAYTTIIALSVASFRRAERLAAHTLQSVATQQSRVDNRTELVAALVDDTMRAAAAALPHTNNRTRLHHTKSNPQPHRGVDYYPAIAFRYRKQ